MIISSKVILLLLVGGILPMIFIIAQERQLGYGQGNSNNNTLSLQGNNNNTSAIPLKNMTKINNATEGEAVPNQVIVMLKDNATSSSLQSLTSQAKNKGGDVLYTYDAQAFRGFTLKAPNDVLKNIIADLKKDPSVASVTADQSVGIMPQQ